MDLSPQFDAYSENARRLGDLSGGQLGSPEAREYNADHEQHGSHPIFKESGWGPDSPCGYSGCKNHNEEFSDRLSDAEGARVHETRTLQPGEMSSQLRPLESVVDHHALARYSAAHPVNRHPPLVAELPGFPGLHVLDGHHRLLAAQKAGRSIEVRVKSG